MFDENKIFLKNVAFYILLWNDPDFTGELWKRFSLEDVDAWVCYGACVPAVQDVKWLYVSSCTFKRKNHKLNANIWFHANRPNDNFTF